MIDRAKLFETLLYWRTSLTVDAFSHLVKRKREHIQRVDIRRINQAHGSNNIYDKRQKQWKMSPDDTFQSVQPKLTEGSLESLVGLTFALRDLQEDEDNTQKPLPENWVEDAFHFIEQTQDINEHRRKRSLIAACLMQTCVEGDYIFKNRGILRIRYWPHTFVRAPQRPHFRGAVEEYDEYGEIKTFENQTKFVDLIPTRFLETENFRLITSLPQKPFLKDEDEAWKNKIDLKFQINPELTSFEKEAVAQEYNIQSANLENHEVKVTVRKALKIYAEREILGRKLHGREIPVWIAQEK